MTEQECDIRQDLDNVDNGNDDTEINFISSRSENYFGMRKI